MTARAVKRHRPKALAKVLRHDPSLLPFGWVMSLGASPIGDRAGGLRPEPPAASQPVGAHPLRGEEVLFPENWRQVHRAKARILFGNQGMHRTAEFVAQIHERALQYLEQAPVLAFGISYGGGALRRSEKEHIAIRVGPMCERGVRLKEMMAAFGLPYPLRRLKASSLYPRSWPAIRLLAQIEPSPLSLAIPADKGQRKWLSHLTRWQQVMAFRSKPRDLLFEWAARELSRNPDVSDVLPMVDFVCSNAAAFNPEWGWRRACEERDLWHDRLSSDAALRELKLKPDFQIDYSDLPDHIEVDGYSFTLLRTPLALFQEGRAMRHCVASYVPDVMNGSSNIYSIRQGAARVATLELRKGKPNQIKAHCNKAPSKAVRMAVDLFVARLPK